MLKDPSMYTVNSFSVFPYGKRRMELMCCFVFHRHVTLVSVSVSHKLAVES